MKNIIFFFLFILIGIFISIKYLQPDFRDPLPLKSDIKSESALKTLPDLYNLEKAPNQSLIGKITQFTGDVNWGSRISVWQPIPNKITLQQGETLRTGTDGKVTAQFEQISIEADSDTELDILQTLPVNFVFAQNYGSVLYNNSGIIPLSIKNKKLLLDMRSAVVLVKVSEYSFITTAEVRKGSIKAAFYDSYGQTVIKTIPEGYIFTFNNSTRKNSLKKM